MNGDDELRQAQLASELEEHLRKKREQEQNQQLELAIAESRKHAPRIPDSDGKFLDDEEFAGLPEPGFRADIGIRG